MPNNQDREISRQMAVKAAILNTVNTPGWGQIKLIADQVVKTAVQEALDEEQPEQGQSKRLKAKALQKGFSELFQYVEQIMQYNPPIDGFEIETD
jgi:hypothetical protein